MGMFSWFTKNKAIRRQHKNRKPSDMRRRLEMELLEDRTMPSNIPVYAASTPVTTATTETQTLTFPSTQPTTLEGNFAQFNTSLGTLQSITITQNGTISSDIQVENVSATTGANIQATVQGTLGLSLTQSNTPISSVSPDALAGTYLAAANPNFTFPDFTFANPTGTNFGWQNASGQSLTTLTGAQLAAFIGSGMVSLTETDQATSTATSVADSNGSNGGNIDYFIQSNATDSVTVTYNYAPSADLAIVKTADPTSAPVGSNVTYTMTVTNNGPDTANQVVVSDPLPSGTTYVSGSGTNWTFTDNNNVITADLSGTLVNQATSTFTITATMPSSPGSVTNTATVSSATPDAILSNNTSSATVSVYVPTSDLAIAKTANPTSTAVSTNVTYTLTVTNNGPDAANQVVVSDPMPAGTTYVSGSGTNWTFSEYNNVITADLTGSLANQATSTFTITATMPSSPGTVTNTATVSSATLDNNPSNNSASAQVTVYQPTDLTITKTASPSPVLTSGTLTYSLTAINNGPGPASQVSVTDPLPAGTTYVSASGTGWTFNNAISNGVDTVTADLTGVLAADASSPFTIVVTAPTAPGSITNTATVATVTPETNYTNNSASVTTQVVQPTDVSIVKTANPNPVEVGADLTYTITVSNAGPAVANQVVVTDPLPTNTTFVSDAGPGWTFSNSTVNGVDTITADLIGSMAVNASSFFTITVQAPSTTGTITNSATVATSTPETNYTNNTSTVVTQVEQTDDLSITKTASAASVQVGGVLTYTLTVSNLEGATANQVVVTDPLPSGETFVSALGPNWTITNNNNVLTATTPSIAEGVSTFFTVSVQAPLVAGAVTNTASVTSNTPDDNLSNNSSSVTTIITNPPGTLYTQNLPQVQFGAIPIISKLQLMGGTLPENEAIQASQIVSLYLTLTGQNPSSATVTNAISQMQLGALSMQSLAAQLWASPQHLTLEVTTAYQTFLGRAPTSSELTAGISQLQAGGSELTLAQSLLTSQEFIQDNNASSLSMVATLDEDVLGSVPSVSSLMTSVQSLATTTWSAYVQQTLTSSQAMANLVTNAYEGILGQAPTSTELQTWTNELTNNQISPDQFVQQLLASSAFGQLAYKNAKL